MFINLITAYVSLKISNVLLYLTNKHAAICGISIVSYRIVSCVSESINKNGKNFPDCLQNKNEQDKNVNQTCRRLFLLSMSIRNIVGLLIRY